MPAARFYTRADRAYRREKLVMAFLGGSSLPELARRFGYHIDHVRKIVRVAGARSC